MPYLLPKNAFGFAWRQIPEKDQGTLVELLKESGTEVGENFEPAKVWRDYHDGSFYIFPKDEEDTILPIFNFKLPDVRAKQQTLEIV